MPRPCRAAATHETRERYAQGVVLGPRLSAVCVGCGWCCLDNPCGVSHSLHGYLPRCPELLWDETGGRYFCRLLTEPRPGVDLAELRAGQGCCAPLNPWRGQPIRRR